jgi:cytochrome c
MIALRRKPGFFRGGIAFGTALTIALFATIARAEEPDDALIEKGERVFVQCLVCHTLEEDEANRAGPNLWNAYDRQSASKPGFQYSPALKRLSIRWTPENLDKWLTNPQAMAPGTKMTFLGLPKEADRLAVIALLKNHSTEASGQQGADDHEGMTR